MKKGFTLVELSIALIVMGILVGLAVGGRKMLDTAKIKADLAQVNIVRDAVATYLNNVSSIPPNLSAQTLIDARFLREEDLQTKMANNNLELETVSVANGNDVQIGSGGNTVSVSNCIYSGEPRIGVRVAVFFGPGTSSSATKDALVGCAADAFMDDGLTGTGSVRLSSPASANTCPATVTDMSQKVDFNGCYNATQTWDKKRYGVVVF